MSRIKVEVIHWNGESLDRNIVVKRRRYEKFVVTLKS